jgi:hypothetical protein
MTDDWSGLATTGAVAVWRLFVTRMGVTSGVAIRQRTRTLGTICVQATTAIANVVTSACATGEGNEVEAVAIGSEIAAEPRVGEVGRGAAI